MKVTSVWKEEMKSVVDNGRNHEVVMDLPGTQGGLDEGAMALEVAVMGYAGCVTTIYAMIAKKSHVDYSSMVCTINAEKGASTIETVEVVLDIVSEATEAKLQRVFDMTCGTCPVGVLFKKAGVAITYKLNVL
jgi:uncharacterized OsmC-like protein